MVFNKITSTSARLVVKNRLACQNIGLNLRNNHTLGVPPRNPMSTGDKVLAATALVLSMITIPAYISYKLPDYQQEDRNQYTGK